MQWPKESLPTRHGSEPLLNLVLITDTWESLAKQGQTSTQLTSRVEC